MVKRFFFISRTRGPFWCFVEREVKQRFSLFVFLRFFLLLEPPASSGVRKRRELESSNDFSLIIQKREFGRAVQNSKNNPKKCFSFSLWGESICFFVIRFSVSFSYTWRGMEEERQRKKEKRGSKEEEKETSKSLLVASSSSPSLSPSILTNAAFSRPPQESKK